LLGEQPLRTIADRGEPSHVSNTLLTLQRLSESCGAGEAAAPVISQEFAQTCALQVLQGKTAQQVNAWDAQSVANSMYACAQLGVYDDRFLGNVQAASPKWLAGSVAAGLKQVAYACRVLQFRDPKLLAGILQRSKHLPTQQKGRLLQGPQRVALAAQVDCGCLGHAAFGQGCLQAGG
jgi:hypothetical protein